MKVLYTLQARESLKEIAFYLKDNSLPSYRIKNYLEDIRGGIQALLTTFPEAGVVSTIGRHSVRKVMVKGCSVLYQYDSQQQAVHVLLIYKHNLPRLK